MNPWGRETWWVIPWSRKINWYILCGFGVLKITLEIFGESRVLNTDRCLAPLALQTPFLATQICCYKEVGFQKLNINPLITFWLKFNWFSENSSCHLLYGPWKWMWKGTNHRILVWASTTDELRTWNPFPSPIAFVFLFYSVHKPGNELDPSRILPLDTRYKENEAVTRI